MSEHILDLYSFGISNAAPFCESYAKFILMQNT